MDELIIRVLQGLASEIDVARLRAWRNESPKNEQRYSQVSAVWSATAAAVPTESGHPVPSADFLIATAEAASAADSRHVQEMPLLLPAMRRTHAGLRAMLYAAAFAAAGFGLAHLTSDRTPTGILAHSEIRTGAGEMTTVSLGDGSSIRLGSRSSVRIHMEGGTRIAHLEGRAFFGVTSDRSARFIVRTQYGEAVVLGTRFEVRTEDEEFRVLVVEGRVQVRAGGSQAELQPGEMSISPAGGPPTTLRVENVYDQLGWMAGALVFQETTLEDAVREIERRYGVNVRVDPRLANMTVSATFTDQTVEAVVQVLSEILNARWVREDDHILITVRQANRNQSR